MKQHDPELDGWRYVVGRLDDPDEDETHDLFQKFARDEGPLGVRLRQMLEARADAFDHRDDPEARSLEIAVFFGVLAWKRTRSESGVFDRIDRVCRFYGRHA